MGYPMPPVRYTCSSSTRTVALPTTTCGAAAGGRRGYWQRWKRRAMLTEVPTVHLTPRPVASSVDELVARATDRRPFVRSDSKSGVGFERLLIGGEPHVLK